jgi:hypothetical protein
MKRTIINPGGTPIRPPAEDRVHYLVTVQGNTPGERQEISAAVLDIGRSENAAIRVSDPGVSALHCRVRLLRDRMLVEDLGSTNGTFVDGSEIGRTTSLPVGAFLQVGTTLLRHEVGVRSDVSHIQQLESEFDRAASYVQALLPQRGIVGGVSADWYFAPSAKLGGDAFGYDMLDDEHFRVYLIDVCGHGAGAALHSVSVMNILRRKSIPGVDLRDPAAVLSGLNDSFPMEDHGGNFFTIWYGVYEIVSRRLIYASAGHPPAVLIGPEGRVPIELGTAGVAIGMIDGIEYRESAITVDPGSRLFVYSDGVFEIVTTTGRDWNRGDLLDVIAGPRAEGVPEPERIHNAVMEVSARPTLEDDFSLVVIET